jgi:RimJ/RimL family protein N-acetyltransferase
VHLEQFDPRTADKQLRACYDVAVANHPTDDPNVPPGSYGVFRNWWAFGWADEPIQTWLATDDTGEPVGTYRLELPQRENRHNGFGHIMVAVAYRRRGLGRLLLAHMADQAASAGRVLLMGDAREDGAGDAFARAVGGRAGLREVRRRLDINDELRGRLPRLRAGAEQHAGGYELRSWQGPVPEDLLESFCAVVTAMGDAPHADEYETTTWDPARQRAAELRTADSGSRTHAVVALATATGEVAAVTQIFVDPQLPGWGWQAITAVTRPHRGHRLGLLVKVAMLERLAEHEPAIRHIPTFNAERNSHMVDVNEQLGYRISDNFRSWTLDVDAARRRSPGLAGQPQS